MTKEKWSKGNDLDCVVSDTPNLHSRDDLVREYGGYLIAESIPKQEYVNLISRAPSMLALLEKALPIIENEAGLREYSMSQHGEDKCVTPYWSEMADLANEISAEIDKARGKGVSDG